VFIILEGLQEFVILIKFGIGCSYRLGHIEITVIHLLCPKSYGLLFRIMSLRQQLSQLLVWSDLFSLIESVISLKVLIDVFKGYFGSILIQHYTAPDKILSSVLIKLSFTFFTNVSLVVVVNYRF
jgi:hypothetical protein